MFFPHQTSIQYTLCQPSFSYFGLSYLNRLRVNPFFLKIAEYQSQYQKNFNMIKAKYQTQICANLSLELVLNILSCEPFLKDSKEVQKGKIYCFLCFLSFFEVHCNKSHEFFV